MNRRFENCYLLSILAVSILPFTGCKTTEPSPQAKNTPAPVAQPTPPPSKVALKNEKLNQVDSLLDQHRSGDLNEEVTLERIRNAIREQQKVRAQQQLAQQPPAPATPEPKRIDPFEEFIEYTPPFRLKGTLRIAGGDSMNPLIQSWTEQFTRHHRKLKIRKEDQGSSTGIPALLENRSDLAPMSRTLMPFEINRFKNKFGYEPVQFHVADDALVLYVHPDNPIRNQGLSLEQLAGIYSQNASKKIRTWGQLGLKGIWANAPIRTYGRNEASGSYSFLKSTVLPDSNYADHIIPVSSSLKLIDAVATHPFAIGYASLSYDNHYVYPLAIRKTDSAKPISATPQSIESGDYPLIRPLYITLNHNPSSKKTVWQQELMRYLFSRNGQQAVKETGYRALPYEVAERELSKLSIVLGQR